MTVSIEIEDVKKIAHLARIAVSDEQLPAYQQSLSNILSMVEQMNAVNTEGILPLAHSFDAVQRLRVDAVSETNQREAFQAIAPAVENGLYLVPKVLE